jgi:hypothetical protein
VSAGSAAVVPLVRRISANAPKTHSSASSPKHNCFTRITPSGLVQARLRGRQNPYRTTAQVRKTATNQLTCLEPWRSAGQQTCGSLYFDACPAAALVRLLRGQARLHLTSTGVGRLRGIDMLICTRWRRSREVREIAQIAFASNLMQQGRSRLGLRTARWHRR